VAAALAVLSLVAACSSAATPAPTPTPTATAVASIQPLATPEATPSPSPTATATPPATPSPTDLGLITAPPGTPMLVDPFISAGISTTVDSGAHAVDPSTYRTTIPGKQYTSVYVVFALKPDVVGKVTMDMTFGDVEVLSQPLTIDYQKINSWGDFKVNFTSDGIPAGVYKATLTYEPTGAVVTQFFAVN
jgi:hypothetical protein